MLFGGWPGQLAFAVLFITHYIKAYLVAGAEIGKLALELGTLASVTSTQQVVGCVLESGRVAAGRELRRIVTQEGTFAC